MVIRLSLPFPFLSGDLGIFCFYRLKTGHPLKSLDWDGQYKEKNQRFARLAKVPHAGEDERKEAAAIVRDAWRQYAGLYYGALAAWALPWLFQVRVFDDGVKHGEARNAVYFHGNPGSK